MIEYAVNIKFTTRNVNIKLISVNEKKFVKKQSNANKIHN